MGHPLQLSDHVTHLGHILQCSLDDSKDIRRSTLEMCKKANMVLSMFSICDPHVKTVLLRYHCLSLYGGVLWSISCNQLKSLEVALNNILRCIWKLPRNCHTRILHKIAQMDSIHNRLMKLSDCYSRRMCESKSSLLRDTFTLFYNSAFTPLGNTHYTAHKYRLKRTSNVPTLYGTYDSTCRCNVGDMDVEYMIRTVCCD